MQVVVVTLSLLILDGIWLGLIAKKMYINAFGSMLRLTNGAIRPLLIPAVIVYIALIVGILVFVIPKARGELIPALLWGGLFGFVVYGTYDFTNLAVMANWPYQIAIIDTLWGMVLCGVTSLITVWITR